MTVGTRTRAIDAIADRLAMGTEMLRAAARHTARRLVEALARSPRHPVTMLVVACEPDDVRLVACLVRESARDIAAVIPGWPGAGTRRRAARVAWLPDAADGRQRWVFDDPGPERISTPADIRVVGAIRGSSAILAALLQVERSCALSVIERERFALTAIRSAHARHAEALMLCDAAAVVHLAWPLPYRVLLGAGRRYEAIIHEHVAHVVRGFADVRTGRPPACLEPRHRDAVRACFAGDQQLYRDWLVGQTVGGDVIPTTVAAAWLAETR